MSQDTFNKFKKNTDGLKSGVSVNGFWKVTVTRADGSVEYKELNNIVTANGLDEIAKLAIANAGSAAAYLAVGTVTAAASLGSTNFGEVANGRKAPGTNTSSKEVFFMIETWGGAADSVTSIALESAAMCNHASSGEGQVFNIVNGVSATLADSDFLHLEAQIQVGSHNL